MQRTAHLPVLQSVSATLLLASVLWVVVFLWTPVNFWILMALATGSLGLLALGLRGPFIIQEGFQPRDIVVGAASAGALYMAFWLGNWVTTSLAPFAPRQISDVYDLRGLVHPALMGLLLVTVIGPGEELYWRGLVQWTFQGRWGTRMGWVLGTAAYGGVHILSANPMVVAAAVVAGAVWGALYAHYRRVLPVLISHALWDLCIFLLFPLRS